MKDDIPLTPRVRRLRDGVRPCPGFFWFSRDIHLRLGASADGRRRHGISSQDALT